ncbi:MAG: hypothetical protein D6788_10975, partial [Planctomycetota bacterium]
MVLLCAAWAPPLVLDVPSKVEGPPEANPSRVDLRTPRATMRTFLLAVQDSLGDRPERIEDAVACLDLTRLTGENVDQQARKLARRLRLVIQTLGVRLDDIPEAPKEDTYVFYRGEPSEGEKTAPLIVLARDPNTGQWRFAPETLASLPALEAIAARKIEEKAEKAQATGEVPAQRRSARATMRTFLEAMNADPPDVEEAVRCLDPSGRDPESWRVKAPELAMALKAVMDRIELVVLDEIPDDPVGPPYVWYAGDAGQIELARVETVPEGKWPADLLPVVGEWRFSPRTVASIESLYKAWERKPLIRELREAGVKERLTLKQRFERRLPDWAKREIGPAAGWQWAALAVFLLLGWMVFLVATWGFGLLLGLWLRRKRIPLEASAQRPIARSSAAFLVVCLLYVAVPWLGLPEPLLGPLLRLLKLLLGVSAVWAAYRYVDVVGSRIAADPDVRLTRFDDVLIPMLRKILRIFVVVVGLLMIAEWMDYEWKTIFAALGIGGVALAFAAQDTIGNFFGSVTVLFDRPFGIGDWIRIGDVEGTVEHVGFRSTRVRTFYHSLVTIPNSKMVNTQVDNFGARRYRRTKVMLSVTYDTPPEKIEAFCEGIRELIRLHPYTRKDYYHVYLNQFSDSSLDILLYMFFETPDWSTELRERHRLFVDILRLAERLGVAFAFPTRTVWLERVAGRGPVEPAPEPAEKEPDAAGVQAAAK